MKINFSDNKNAIIGGVLAFSLIWLGVFLSAKKYELEYDYEEFTSDKKIRYLMISYLFKRNLIGNMEFCKKQFLGTVVPKSEKLCVLAFFGTPNKVIGNKFSYELISDEIILWRKYLIIEFNNEEITSTKIVHFDI